MKEVQCKRCGNTDPTLFGYRNGKYYCRACINYNGKIANISKKIKPKITHPKIDYALSNEQEKVANNARESKEVYINAVCGSGKTEMVFASIDKALSEGRRVGFVIPRREVVKEIFDRLKEVYPQLQISLVYGGHSEFLDGDIIVLTAHQCYRYPKKFGLLILDEYDAFPLKGDETLLRIVERTCYDQKIFLSATFSEQELLGHKQLEVRRRYHHYDLPVPTVILGTFLSLFIKLLKFIYKNRKNTKFIYIPTIKDGIKMNKLLHLFFIRSVLFSSQSENKTRLYQDIKDRKIKTVVTTTILERGITVKNLMVAVFNASHPIFDYRTLIQIEGRAGRKKDAPTGQVLFYTTKITANIEKAINEIVDKNNRINY